MAESYTSLKGKNILIVGGQRIGQVIAEWFIERGANVGMTYLQSEQEVATVKERDAEKKHKGFFMKADVAKDADVHAFVQAAANFYESLHGLVYMASIFPKSGTQDQSMEKWQQMMEVHVLGAERFATALRPHFEKNIDGGKMIIFSDGAAENQKPYAGFRDYLVSKAAASALLRSLAVDYAPKILVNGIAPGPILPPPDYTEEEKREVAELSLLKRWGGADEIARAVMYLMEQSFVTGQVLTVDGGRYLFSQ